MTDQGDKVLTLKQGVKLEKPKSFIGLIDTDEVNAIFSKWNIFFTNMVDAN